MTREKRKRERNVSCRRNRSWSQVSQGRDRKREGNAERTNLQSNRKLRSHTMTNVYEDERRDTVMSLETWSRVLGCPSIYPSNNWWEKNTKSVTLWVTLVIKWNSFNEFDRLKRRSQAENLQEAVTWCSLRVLHVPPGPGSGPPPLQRFWCCWVWSRQAEGRLTRNELSHVAPPLTRVTDSDSPATAGVCGHSIHMWEALPPTPI